jgi:hypothetical protein
VIGSRACSPCSRPAELIEAATTSA